MSFQSIEERIAAEWPVIKAFIATHPYFCVGVAFFVGGLVGHIL